jgi:hypothetical protein
MHRYKKWHVCVYYCHSIAQLLQFKNPSFGWVRFTSICLFFLEYEHVGQKYSGYWIPMKRILIVMLGTAFLVS